MADDRASASNAGPQTRPPAAAGPDECPRDRAADDASDGDSDSEWEYEYSTHETETYYLTVELSYPEFKGTATRNPHHSRGGYYKKWLEQPQDPEAAPPPAQPTARPQGRDSDAHGTQAEGLNDHRGDRAVNDADDDMSMIHPHLREPGGPVGGGEDTATANDSDPEREPERDPERDPNDEHDAEQQGHEDEEQGDAADLEPTSDIQILDLHSKRPIISYRGHVFEGQWAEMIGTEVILAQNEGQSPGELPALRHLADSVDLLGASASRILTKRKTLRPKVAVEDSLAPIQREFNINIPAGKNRLGERAQQANFLEKLMALKIKRGDKDEVTVYAQDGVGKDFPDNQDPNFRPRKRRMRSGAGGEGSRDAGARRRLSGRGARRGRLLESRAPTRGDDVAAAGSSLRGSLGAHASGGLSTPTPTRWADLRAQGRQEDDGEYDASSDASMNENDGDDYAKADDDQRR